MQQHLHDPAPPKPPAGKRHRQRPGVIQLGAASGARGQRRFAQQQLTRRAVYREQAVALAGAPAASR